MSFIKFRTSQISLCPNNENKLNTTVVRKGLENQMMGKVPPSYSTDPAWVLPAASVCPPPATPAVSTALQTFPLIPSFTALMETSRLTNKSTRSYPIESAALSDIIKMAHVQCEEQVGFTNTHAKAKYGLNCTLPAQSVHCVALLRVPNLSLLHA